MILSAEKKEYLFALGATMILVFVYLFLMYEVGGKTSFVAMFPLVTIVLFSLLSFHFSVLILLLSLFIDNNVFNYSAGVWASLVVGLSFLLHYRKEMSHYRNPIFLPLVVYGCCVVPSLINSIVPLMSMAGLLNVVAFIIVEYTVFVMIRSFKDVQIIFIIALALALLNSLNIFYLASIGVRRPFGITGIVFVDLSALLISLSVIQSFFSKGLYRILLLTIALILSIALTLTKTRNTIASIFITLVLTGLILFINPALMQVTRRQIVKTIGWGAVILSIVVGVVMLVNPSMKGRIAELFVNPRYGLDASNGNVENSLLSRLMIWDTAFNGFKAHPFIGIGVYAFPYSSHLYYRLPKMFFKPIVKGLTAHEAYLSVLSETGILGMVGFLFFLIFCIYTASHVLHGVKGTKNGHFKLGSFIAVVYCYISMIFSDAWLFGQLIVILGIVFGINFGLQKIIRETPGII